MEEAAWQALVLAEDRGESPVAAVKIARLRAARTELPSDVTARLEALEHGVESRGNYQLVVAVVSSAGSMDFR